MSRKKAIELAKQGCIVEAYEELWHLDPDKKHEPFTERQLVFARLIELGAFDPILEDLSDDPELSDFDKAILQGRRVSD